MTLIEGHYPPCSVPFRQDHDTEVGQTRVEITISILEVHDNGVILGVEARDGEPATSQVLEKGQSRLSTEASAEQVVHLRR